MVEDSFALKKSETKKGYGGNWMILSSWPGMYLNFRKTRACGRET